jgi:hypothetical protein
MSNTRYIEFDSTYRNRNEWPEPAEFEVLISQSGRKGQYDAVDPVSLSTPINNFVWQSNAFDLNPGAPPAGYTLGSFITLEVTSNASGLPGASDNGSIIEAIIPGASTSQLQTMDNYYLNAVVYDETGTLSAFRIKEYKYLGSGRVQMVVTTTGSIVDGNSIRIVDPTDITDLTNPFFFVPNGREGNNAYVNSILYNITRNNYATIIEYDSSTHIAKTTDITGLGWTLRDHFCIRKEVPAETGVVTNNVASATNISLPVTTASNIQNFYKNGFIRVNSTTTNEVHRIIRYETFQGQALGGSNITVQLPPGSSPIVGYYNGMFIQIITGTSAGDTRQVVNYIPATSTTNAIVTVNVPFTVVVNTGDQFAFRNIVSLPFSTPVSFGDIFEVEQFSYDNVNPFVYTGSQVSQQEMVCYEVELLNLILPNAVLNAGLGSRIAFYPYIYVELSNVSGSGAGLTNIIYSNNPNSTRMIFRVPVDDVPNPLISSFVKIDGDGMVQTIKFKPNDNLRFSVRLPNGELYKTVLEEMYGPNPPNPLSQISAMFSIKRL